MSAPLPQMDLPIRIEMVARILGVPIVGKDLLPGVACIVERVGEDLAGHAYVYIIHLHGKIDRAQHYVGSAQNLPQRLKQHRRKWPRYCLTATDLAELALVSSLNDCTGMNALQDKVYRRKQTFLAAAAKRLGRGLAEDDQAILLHLAKKHRANGLLMAANQRGIAWSVARVFQADRKLEFALKAQKHIRRHCPICQGDDLPF